MVKYASFVLLLIVAGCAGETAKQKEPNNIVPKPLDLSNGVSFLPRDVPQDAVPEPMLLVHLTVYRVLVPARAISHDEEFWKHIDEHAVDASTYEQLYMNGIRVGVAPRTDWDYFKKILESDAPVTQVTQATSVAATIEMPVNKDVAEQFIAYYHPLNGLVGQMYGRSENAITVRFGPVPRHPGDVRLTVTPLVRSQRTEVQYTVRNEEMVRDFVRPEYLFDIKLMVDVPLNNFLVVAPSADADNSSSLGRKFLYTDGNGQQFEQVLLISPQPFQFEKPTTAPTTRPIAAGVDR